MVLLSRHLRCCQTLFNHLNLKFTSPSVSRFDLHVQTDDTFPNKPNSFNIWRDRTVRVGGTFIVSARTTCPSSIQQFINGSYPPVYTPQSSQSCYHTQWIQTAAVLGGNNFGHARLSADRLRFPSLRLQHRVAAQRSHIKALMGTSTGRCLTGPLRTSLHAPAVSFTQRDSRKHRARSVKKEMCSWAASVILQVPHIYDKTETL